MDGDPPFGGPRPAIPPLPLPGRPPAQDAPPVGPSSRRPHTGRWQPTVVDGTPTGPPEAESDAAFAALLVDLGLLDTVTRAALLSAPRPSGMTLGPLLVLRGLLSEAELLSAWSIFYGLDLVDLAHQPPDPDAARHLPAALALAAGAVPLRRVGAALIIATSRPDRIAALMRALPPSPRLVPVLASTRQILDAQRDLYGPALARAAEGQAPAAFSCRGWQPARSSQIAGCAVLLLALGLIWSAQGVAIGLSLLAIAVFSANTALKLAAVIAARRAEAACAPAATGPAPPGASEPLHRATVSLLVPLYDEDTVLPELVGRLARLDYPPEHLDILFCVEAGDTGTRRVLDSLQLAPFMRVIVVPDGQPRTKPRALNYALNFARGSIIGIYDAEDRPEPDQIRKVAARFAELPPEVACLQGRLDYYNSRHNLMARSFTIEYAGWFRLVLPGVARLGLVVPLGGTTLFLRRNAIDAVGRWDAHNVTEDAELGLRLARAGFRTEILETTTFEEANAAAWPWVRQRSRWLKGYLITWATAMRAPTALWRDLGTLRFAALQVQLLGAVLGCLLAPVLWSFAVKMLGWWHPLDALFSTTGYLILGGYMLSGLGLGLYVSWYGTRAAHLSGLRPWSPVVEAYHALATAAAWIAVLELVKKPYFWSKTQHGAFSTPARLPAE